MNGFTAFWSAYPRKVGKLAAQKAYTKARQTVSAEDLLAGLERYKVTKPSYADWCHAKTWLTQGRWLDQDDTPVGRPCPRCGGMPACQSYAQCNERVFGKRA